MARRGPKRLHDLSLPEANWSVPARSLDMGGLRRETTNRLRRGYRDQFKTLPVSYRFDRSSFGEGYAGDRTGTVVSGASQQTVAKTLSPKLFVRQNSSFQRTENLMQNGEDPSGALQAAAVGQVK